MQFSLSLLQNDPDFAALFKKKTEVVKKDKTNLVSAATSYNESHRQEIEEGTLKRALMLEEGKRNGLSEEEVFHGNSLFIPTRQTPILNFLYFMMRSEERTSQKQVIVEKLMSMYQLFVEKEGPEQAERKMKLLLEEEERLMRTEKEDHTVHARHKGEGEKEYQDVVGFLYGNITQDTFVKIKKLKALSRSQNKQEAFSAYTKCLELCERHGLEFDKVPL